MQPLASFPAIWISAKSFNLLTWTVPISILYANGPFHLIVTRTGGRRQQYAVEVVTIDLGRLVRARNEFSERQSRVIKAACQRYQALFVLLIDLLRKKALLYSDEKEVIAGLTIGKLLIVPGTNLRCIAD